MNYINLIHLEGSFLPVTLEQLARERGVLWTDRKTPCIIQDAAESAQAVASQLTRRAVDNKQCVIPALHMISTSSFAMYTFSIAVFVQALTLISFSAVADYGKKYHARVSVV
jgi:UMF1 family MFS transporter